VLEKYKAFNCKCNWFAQKSLCFKMSKNTTKNFVQSAVADVLNPFSPSIISRPRLNGTYAVLTPDILVVL